MCIHLLRGHLPRSGEDIRTRSQVFDESDGAQILIYKVS